MARVFQLGRTFRQHEQGTCDPTPSVDRMVASSGAVHRLTIRARDVDPRNSSLRDGAHLLGHRWVTSVDVSDVLFLCGNLDDVARKRFAGVAVDPLLQVGSWDVDATIPAPDTVDMVVVETSPLPGVTDAAATSAIEVARQLGLSVDQVATGRRVALGVDPDHRPDIASIDRLATSLLANPVVEHHVIGTITPTFVPSAASDGAEPTDSSHEVSVEVERFDIAGMDPAALTELNVHRAMWLDPAELDALAAHFRVLGRPATDVELETIAQTWSEHCAHKTFRAAITTTDGATVEPLLAQLRASTDRIAAPFVRSAFVGNAGIVSFEPGVSVALKAETHNHPSAIEPFGGANTGVGGVIRDVLGAAHRPVAVTDVLCFGPSDLAPADLPTGVIHPRFIRDGVVAGVADYGNKMGLPNVAGAVMYDPGYTANPLVFCGCIGIADDRPLPTGPFPGDAVVVVGGRTGRDGIRGATFSSATMDATTGDVAGASVQIGDPIVEKLVMEFLDDALPHCTAVTDCGAGGLSSAVGEMAEHVGADVDLALAPLKYPGLAPWEIWLSEAQERMVLAIAPEQLDIVREHARRHEVELTVLGRFTGDGVLRVRHGRDLVLELDTSFLHDGRPRRSLIAELPSPQRGSDPTVPCPDRARLADLVIRLLAHPNIASKVDVVRRYDHEIRGATLVRPIVGVGADAPADGTVLAEPDAGTGLAIGIGVNPWMGVLDPERMARAVVDEAIRNLVAVGGDPDRVALMDNFSWGDPRRPSTLGALVAAVEGCCAAADLHGAPFVSGKDSLNNEYEGTDGVRRSVPPTLVITAVAPVPDADRVVTPELRAPGDVLVALGRTTHDLGGSHLSMIAPDLVEGARTVPSPDPAAPERYRNLHALIRRGVIRSCHDLAEGGLAVAVSEMAIAGGLGVALDPASVDALADGDTVAAFFAESNGRFLVAVTPADLDEVLAVMAPTGATMVGTVVAEPSVDLGRTTLDLQSVRRAFTTTVTS
jgi:phosphoribosylformylglycinamidine synthase subunit PurSL